ncbi:MAG: DNA polymerase III subunit delta [Massilibacteroides sp.]|nr:DNA polymerase III subunit delta [Massilibacteroides sp.]
MFFKDIIGQEKLIEHLRHTIEKENLPHAQLFCGPAGHGGFALAMAFAQYLQCDHPTNGEPCGVCPSCKQHQQFVHPDMHFVFPIVKKNDSDTCDTYLAPWRSFLVDRPYFSYGEWLAHLGAEKKQALIYASESEEIARKMKFKAYSARYKVLLVWMPEKMHIACANKLLKFIEEPPEHTIILMVSEEPDLVLGTIQSRSQRINIPPIGSKALEQAMRDQYGLTAEDATHIAHLAKGDLLTATDIISVNKEKEYFLTIFINMMRLSWSRDIAGMKQLAEDLSKIGRERQKALFAYFQHLTRENFIKHFEATDLNYMNRAENTFSTKFSPYVNERNVIDIMNELTLAESHITQNTNAKMVFFDTFLRLSVLIRR